jgi:hypothetical protein
MSDQSKILEDHADPSSEGRQYLAGSLAQLLAEQPNPPARRTLRKIQELEKRRFSGTRRTGEKIEASARKPEIEIAQHFCARAVAQADAIEFGNRWQLVRPPLQLGRDPVPCQVSFIPVYRLHNVPEEGF